MTGHKLPAFRGMKKKTHFKPDVSPGVCQALKPFGVRLGPSTLQPSPSRDSNFFFSFS